MVKVVDPRNARNDEYREQLEAIEASNQCPFCCKPAGLTFTDPEETKLFIRSHEGNHWWVKHNRHLIDGARVHLVLIAKRHVLRSNQLRNEELVDLFRTAALLDIKFHAKGRVLYMREGDTALTGATVCHLHAQYIVPKEDQAVTLRFGPPPGRP